MDQKVCKSLDKTMQIAGVDNDNIFIWSPYKLPPYPKSILDEHLDYRTIGDSELE